MRILGADSFVGKTTSINAIPVNVLKDNDFCLVKIEVGDINYTPAIYFLEYTASDGSPENIPYIIVPLDNIEGDDGGRWKLKDVFVNRFHAGSISTNTIVPEVPGNPITIGDNFTLSPNGVLIDGQLTINSDLTKPPLIINSSVMVENLNSEFISGEGINSFIRNYNFDTGIPNGVSQFDVYFAHNVVTPPHYTVLVDICNVTDPNPSIYSHIIIRKEQEYFTIKFSGIIDSANYSLHYLVVGEIASPYLPPPLPAGNAGVVWESVSVNTTAAAAGGYFVNTSTGPVIITLPSSAAVGDTIEIVDHYGSFSTNNCIIFRNGHKIMGITEDFYCDIDNSCVIMVYSGLTQGWRITDYTIK